MRQPNFRGGRRAGAVVRIVVAAAVLLVAADAVASRPSTERSILVRPHVNPPQFVGMPTSLEKTVGETVTLDVTATDPDGTTPVLQAFDLPPEASFDDYGDGTGFFECELVGAGTFDISFVASDGLLADTAIVHLTVLGPNRPPEFVEMPAYLEGAVGETVRLDVAASDPDGTTPVLTAYDLPPGATFTDNGDGTARFEYAPVDAGLFDIGFVASDGELADTVTVILFVYVPGELPDDLQNADFSFDVVATYSSAGQIDQMRLEDIDCDGLDEVLFRETLAGQVPALKIWSPAQGRFFDLPSAPEVRGYSLRPGQGELEPVLWTDYNAVQVLNSSKTGWETVAVLPYVAQSFHWLPENPFGAQIAYQRGNHLHEYSESPIEDCNFTHDRYWSDVVLMPGDSTVVYDSVGYTGAEFAAGALDPWCWRQVFTGTTLEHLLIPSSWRDDDVKGGMDCNPAWTVNWFTDIDMLDRNADGPQRVERVWHFRQGYMFILPHPSYDENLIGLGQLARTGGPVRLGFVGRANSYEPWRMSVLSNPNGWVASEVEFDFNWGFRRGGIVTVDSNSAEVMLLGGDDADAFLFAIPDAEPLAGLNLPYSGRFLTGYVGNQGYRDLVFSTGTQVEIVRLTVVHPNAPPEFQEMPATLDAIAGDTVTLDVAATDPDGTTPVLSAYDLPPGGTFTDNGDGTGRFTCFAGTLQTYDIGFVASDGVLADTAIVRLTIEQGNLPPLFVDVSPTTFAEYGETVTIDVMAVDYDGDPLVLTAFDMPPGAVFSDHGDGTGRFELTITDPDLESTFIGFVASDGELADTAYVMLVLPHFDELPDDLQDKEFNFDLVSSYTSPGQIDQMRLEDVDLDGLDEVLFRETVAGQVPALRIWSQAQGRFLDLPSAPEVRGYSLRPGDGELEPVLWTDDNAVQVLNASKTGWETVAVLPYVAQSFHWLPENPFGAQIAYQRGNHLHDYSESPIEDCNFTHDRYWSDVVLMPGDSTVIYESVGYTGADCNASALDPWCWRQVFAGTSLEHLVIPSSWRDDYVKGGMDCNPTHSVEWYTDLYALDRDMGSPQRIKRLWYFGQYDIAGWTPPTYGESLIGLGRLGFPGSATRLACVGRGFSYNPWRMTILSNLDGWAASEVEFTFGWSFWRGGIVTVDSNSAEVMLLGGDDPDAFLFAIPDAEPLAHLSLPRSGRFLTGYVRNSGYRDLVFNSGSTVEILRLTIETPHVPQTLHVPGAYPSIQAGIDAARNGDTVLVAPGIYDEAIDFLGKAIKVIGAGGPAVTVLQPSFDGTAVRLTTFEGPDAELSGFTMICGPRHYAIEVGNGATPVIQNNIFEDYAVGQALISVSAAHPRIQRNLFLANGGFACIRVYSGAAEVVNNTMVGNVRGLLNYGESSTIKNNIIASCSEYGIHAPVGVIDYNDFWDNAADRYDEKTLPGAHDMSQDPGFRDAAAGDYHLVMESFCVDNGDPDPKCTDADGTRGDMGAYPIGTEFQPRAAERCIVGEKRERVVDHTPALAWRFLGSGAQAAYELEVGSDNDWSVAEMWATGPVTSPDTTVVYAGSPLSDGGDYVYRVRVHDGTAWGGWSHGFFHMNALPSVPEPFFPVEDGVVSGDAVVLSVANAADPENDSLTYDFEVYSDMGLTVLEAAESGVIEQEEYTEIALTEALPPSRYWWRVRAHDGWESSTWSAAATFIVRGDQVIHVPGDQPSIQLGIKAAGNGDTVLVDPGTYTENIDLLGKRVVVRSAGGAAVTVLAAADTMLPVVSFETGEPKGAEISGFTITGGREKSGIVCIESSPTITGNVITGNRAGGTQSDGGGAIHMVSTSASMIRGNVIHHNDAISHSGEIHYAGAIHMRYSRADTIWGNVMYANPGVGDVRFLSSDVVIVNNTISVTTWGGIMHQNCCPYYGTAEVRNNIIFFAPEVAVYSGNDYMVADYNCTFANKRNYQGVGPGAGSVFADASFVDSAAGDYRLLGDSPCIDAGDPDPVFNDPDGSRCDIGAIPYTGTLVGDVNGDGVVDLLDVVEAVDVRYRTVKAGLSTADSLGHNLSAPSADAIRKLIERLYETQSSASTKPR